MDFGRMMEMAQKVKQAIQTNQEEAMKTQFTGEAGAGLVRVVATGGFEVVEVKIDASLFSEKEQSFVEDLIRAAANQALSKANEHMRNRMQNLAQDVGVDPSALGIPLGSL